MKRIMLLESLVLTLVRAVQPSMQPTMLPVRHWGLMCRPMGIIEIPVTNVVHQTSKT